MQNNSPERARAASGFTLVELMVATVVLTVAIGAALQSLRVSSDSFQAGQTSGEAHEVCRTVVDELALHMLPGRVVFTAAVGATPPEVRVQAPIDIGEDTNGDGLLGPSEDANGNALLDLTDGDVLDPAGNIEWGVEETWGASLGGTATFRFVQSRTLSEAAANTDFNGDGDQGDTFRLGNIERRTPGGRVRTLGRGWVMLDALSATADLDFDGTPDPLFSVTTDTNGLIETVTINIWIITQDRKGRYMKMNEKTCVRLRNDQS